MVVHLVFEDPVLSIARSFKLWTWRETTFGHATLPLRNENKAGRLLHNSGTEMGQAWMD